MTRRSLYVLALALALLVPNRAVPQVTPEAAMASIIAGLQTGTMYWNRFYPSLRAVIAAQTGGTGRYPQLAALGPVQNVIILNGWPLPGGSFYNFRSFFASGAVDWQLAADNQGNIVALSFYPANIQVAPRPKSPSDPDGGDDDPPPPPTKRTRAAPIDGGGGKKVNPKSEDDACKLYPDLC